VSQKLSRNIGIMRHSFATRKCPALLDGHDCRGNPKFHDILATTGATQAVRLLCGSQHECWVGPNPWLTHEIAPVELLGPRSALRLSENPRR